LDFRTVNYRIPGLVACNHTYKVSDDCQKAGR